MRVFPSFTLAHKTLRSDLVKYGSRVHAPRWQGVDVSNKPEMAMQEMLGWSFSVILRGIEDLDHWRKDVQPNLPWADDHFAERVGGKPLNPGERWKNWPWSNSADHFRKHKGRFSHTYMERIWPKYAGQYDANGKPVIAPEMMNSLMGIRFEYGDLNDLVDHLASDPLSRQAYLPIWFPEDGTCKGRKPCTLGYHFIMRGDYLHITYYIRSCDFVRHYSDDVYLAVRLGLWILDRLRERDERWKTVKMGMFTFHCVSMHCFVNDLQKLKSDEKDTASTNASG